MDENLPFILGSAIFGSSVAGYVLGRSRRSWSRRRMKNSATSLVRSVAVTNCDEIAEAVFRRLAAETELGAEPRSQPPTGQEPNNSDEDATTFFVSADFLRDSFRCLLKDGERYGQFRESFHYATGLQVAAESFAITEILPVEFAEQSAVGVRVADRSSIAAFNRLEQMGMPLVAHFHSHPGQGQTANYPSSTDLRFQERLERGGHVAIGGIFARGDGVAHVRFFASQDRKFQVNVQGSLVERKDDHVFELALADSAL